MGNLIFRSSKTSKKCTKCHGFLNTDKKCEDCDLGFKGSDFKERDEVESAHYAQAPIVDRTGNQTVNETEYKGAQGETDECITEVDSDFIGEIVRIPVEHCNTLITETLEIFEDISKECAHRKENCQNYCIGCRKYICESCIYAHKDHDFKAVSDMLQIMRTKIKFLQNENKTHKLKMLSNHDELKTLKLEQQRHYGSAKEAIERRHSELLCQLIIRTERSLGDASEQWEIYLKRYKPIKTHIEKLIYVHTKRGTIQKILKQNNAIKIITAVDRLESRFPKSSAENVFTLSKINYTFKLNISNSWQFPNLWLIKCNDNPINITKIIDCAVKLPIINKIHSIDTSGNDLLLANSSKIVQSRSTAIRLVPFFEMELKNKCMSVFGPNEICVCHRNTVMQVNHGEAPKCVREFEDLYPQNCFVCNGFIMVCLTSESKFDKHSLPTRTEIQKLTHRGETVVRLNKRKNGTNYFTFPWRCLEHLFSFEIYVIDREGSMHGQVLIFDDSFNFKRIYNGRQIIRTAGKNKFFPTDMACSSTGFTVVTDKNNHILHVLNQSGEAVYYILTDQICNCRLDSPSSIAIDKLNNIYIVGTPSSCIVAVLRYPQISNRS